MQPFTGLYVDTIAVNVDRFMLFVGKNGLPAIATRQPMTYEKHRAPARAPRAGVNGGSAPDSHRVIKKWITNV